MFKIENPSIVLQEKLIYSLGLQTIFQDQNADNLTVQIKRITDNNFILLYSSSSGVNDILLLDAMVI